MQEKIFIYEFTICLLDGYQHDAAITSPEITLENLAIFIKERGYFADSNRVIPWHSISSIDSLYCLGEVPLND
jgi:hypothetical protein